MVKVRHISITAVVAALAFGAFSGTASAGSYNGVCESSNGGEVCLYDANNQTGRVYDTLYSKPSYTGTYYGTNVGIDNTVNSTWNRDPDTTVSFYQFANYSGLGLGQLGGGKTNWSQFGEENSWSSHCFANNPACPG